MTKKEIRMRQMTGLELAKIFHANYERLAPDFGYETREDTREFDEASKNGRLMVATCEAVLNYLQAEQTDSVFDEVKDYLEKNNIAIDDLDRMAREVKNDVFSGNVSGDVSLVTQIDFDAWHEQMQSAGWVSVRDRNGNIIQYQMERPRGRTFIVNSMHFSFFAGLRQVPPWL